MSQEHTSFLDNMPIGIPEDWIYQDVVRYIYIQNLKLGKSLPVLMKERTHFASISGATGLFLREYWNE